MLSIKEEVMQVKVALSQPLNNTGCSIEVEKWLATVAQGLRGTSVELNAIGQLDGLPQEEREECEGRLRASLQLFAILLIAAFQIDKKAGPKRATPGSRIILKGINRMTEGLHEVDLRYQ